MSLFQHQPRIRPVCSSDAEAMARYVDALGPRGRCLRLHGEGAQGPLALASCLGATDAVACRAWVACVGTDDGERIVGEARWVHADATGLLAALAISVADAWQDRSLAEHLLDVLLDAAARARTPFLEAEIAAGDERMLALMRRRGFEADPYDEAAEGRIRLFRHRRIAAASSGAGLWHLLRAAGAQGMSSLSSRSAAAASSRAPRSSRLSTVAAPSASVAARRL